MQDVRIDLAGLGRGDDVFGVGSVDLTDTSARLRYMDELGVDVHVMFPTWFLSSRVANVMAEAAMMRSYNRWLAERSADSGGRLRWAVNVPLRTMDRALQEIEFGRTHGAVGVFIKGITHGMSIRDPYLLPLFEKAQDLDMVIALHVGSEGVAYSYQDPGRWLYLTVLPVPGAVAALLQSDLCDRFPRLRWAFLEAGAAWVPYIAQEVFRSVDVRGFGEAGWRQPAREAFAESEIYIACQMDDDITYLSDVVGRECLVHGTDFGHLDSGSDPNGLHIIASRDDLDPVLRSNIVDSVGRRLYGIDRDFTPAPAASIQGYAINSHRIPFAGDRHLAKPAAHLVPQLEEGGVQRVPVA
jgi:predicted TIM-barrel fold metal-dependent hydrolase